MFCSKCGKENSDSAVFCASCGANVGSGAATTKSNASIGSGSTVGNRAREQMAFGKSISVCFSKFSDFSGRASRAEFWWFYLFTLLISWGAMLVDRTQVLSGLISLGLICPSIAAGSRRLHDTNRSGWMQLIVLTIIGAIPLIIWLASTGSDQDNQYGSAIK